MSVSPASPTLTSVTLAPGATMKDLPSELSAIRIPPPTSPNVFPAGTGTGLGATPNAVPRTTIPFGRSVRKPNADGAAWVSVLFASGSA